MNASIIRLNLTAACISKSIYLHYINVILLHLGILLHEKMKINKEYVKNTVYKNKM
jgi:hypothetical protein